MKAKRAISLLLIVMMVVSLLPVASFADVTEVKLSDDYRIELVAKAKTYSAASGVQLDVMMSAGSTGTIGGATFTLAYDKNVLRLANRNTGAAANSPVGAWSEAFDLESLSKFSLASSTYAALGTGNYDTVYVDMSLSGGTTTFNGAEKVATLYFSFVGSKTINDLTTKSFHLASAAEKKGTYRMLISDGSHNYMLGSTNPVNDGDTIFTLDESQFSISYSGFTPSEPVQELGSFTLKKGSSEATAETVAVPAATEITAPATNKVVLTLKAEAKEQGTNDDMSFPADAVWALCKDSSDSCGDAYTSSDAPAGVTLTPDSTNKNTVTLALAPSAAAGTHWIKVSKGNVSKACKVTVTKEDAGVAAVVTITGDSSATIPATGTAKKTYSATVTDKYGANITNQAVTWTLKAAVDGVAIATANGDAEVTITGGTSTTDSDGIAANGAKFTVVATSDAKNTIKAEKEVTMSTKSIHINDKTTPDTIDALDYENANGVAPSTVLTPSALAAKVVTNVTDDDGAAVNATWTITSPATLAWGPNTVTLTATYNDGTDTMTATKDVTVKVLKTIDAGDIIVAARNYDGTANVAANATASIKSDVTTGHTGISVTKVEGTYADKDVGDGKNVTLTTLTLNVTDTDYYKTTATLTGKAKGDIKMDSTNKLTLKKKAADATPSTSGWKLDDVLDADNLQTDDTLDALFGAPTVDANDPAVYTAGGVTLTFYIADPENDGKYIKATEALAAGTEYYIDVAVNAANAPATATKNYSVKDVSASVSGTPITSVSGCTKATFSDPPVYTGGGSSNKNKDKDKTDKEHFVHGYEDGKFRPGNLIKRSEIAQMIANLHKVFDKAIKYPSAGRDVPADQWYTAPVNFCGQQGIMTGDESGMRPEDTIKRSELAVVLVRFLGLKLDTNTGFADVKADDWYAGYVGALKNAGITKGYEDNTFRANQDITRSEAVAMINRALGLTEADVDAFDIIPADLDDIADWAKQEILISMNADITPYKK